MLEVKNDPKGDRAKAFSWLQNVTSWNLKPLTAHRVGMNMQPHNFEYKPDYAVLPGETLLEILTDKGMTQFQLAERVGKDPKIIDEIMRGKIPITSEIALQFEQVLGVPASFWNNLERNYRQALARLTETESSVP